MVLHLRGYRFLRWNHLKMSWLLLCSLDGTVSIVSCDESNVASAWRGSGGWNVIPDWNAVWWGCNDWVVVPDWDAGAWRGGNDWVVVPIEMQELGEVVIIELWSLIEMWVLDEVVMIISADLRNLQNYRI